MARVVHREIETGWPARFFR